MADDDYADDFAEEENDAPGGAEGGGMNPGDAVAAQIELAQNEQEMAARKHLRSLRPQKVRSESSSPCYVSPHQMPVGHRRHHIRTPSPSPPSPSLNSHKSRRTHTV
jgi:hypothetical protein